MNWYIITCLANSLSKQSAQAGALPKVLPTETVSFHHYPSRVSQRRVVVYSCQFSGDVPILCRIICKLGPNQSLFSVNWSHVTYIGWEREGSVAGVGHFFMKLTCAFRARFDPIPYIPLPLDDGVLLFNFMASWVKWHLVHDGQFRLHGSLVAHGQVLSLC